MKTLLIRGGVEQNPGPPKSWAETLFAGGTFHKEAVKSLTPTQLEKASQAMRIIAAAKTTDKATPPAAAAKPKTAKPVREFAVKIVQEKKQEKKQKNKKCAACARFHAKGACPKEPPKINSTTAMCYKCGERGHMASECKAKAAVCFACGKAGHRAAECRTKIGGSKSCFTCGKQGHLANACTKGATTKTVGKRHEPKQGAKNVKQPQKEAKEVRPVVMTKTRHGTETEVKEESAHGETVAANVDVAMRAGERLLTRRFDIWRLEAEAQVDASRASKMLGLAQNAKNISVEMAKAMASERFAHVVLPTAEATTDAINQLEGLNDHERPMACVAEATVPQAKQLPRQVGKFSLVFVVGRSTQGQFASASPGSNDAKLKPKGWLYAVYAVRPSQSRLTMVECGVSVRAEATAVLRMHPTHNAAAAPAATTGTTAPAGAGAAKADAAEAEEDARQARQEVLIYKGRCEANDVDIQRLKARLAELEKEAQTRAAAEKETMAMQAHAFHEESLRIVRQKAQEEALLRAAKERELLEAAEHHAEKAREATAQAERAEAEKVALQQKRDEEIRAASHAEAVAAAQLAAAQEEKEKAQQREREADARRQTAEEQAAREINTRRETAEVAAARIAEAGASADQARRDAAKAEKERLRAVALLELEQSQKQRIEAQNLAELGALREEKENLDYALKEAQQKFFSQHLHLTAMQDRLKEAIDEGKAAAEAERLKVRQEIEHERDRYQQAVAWLHQKAGEAVAEETERLKAVAREAWEHQQRERVTLEQKYLETTEAVAATCRELAVVKAEHNVLRTKTQHQNAMLEQQRQQMLLLNESRKQEKEVELAAKKRECRDVKVRMRLLRVYAEERRVCMDYAEEVAKIQVDGSNWHDEAKSIADTLRLTLEQPTPQNVQTGRSVLLVSGQVIFLVEIKGMEFKGLDGRGGTVHCNGENVQRVARRCTPKRSGIVSELSSSDEDDAPTVDGDGKDARPPPKKKAMPESATDGRTIAAAPALPATDETAPAFPQGTH